MPFSTHDTSGLGHSCAKDYNGGWWYNQCLRSNPNGFNYQARSIKDGKGIVWQSWRGLRHSLLATQMAVFPSGKN